VEEINEDESIQHDLQPPQLMTRLGRAGVEGRDGLEASIELAIDQLRPDGDTLNQRRATILAEMSRLDKELSRLTAAVASGGDLPALLAVLKEREVSRKRCERAVLELEATARIGQRDLSRLEREIRHRLADWRTMLRREVPEARELLRNLIVGRIVFTPRPETRLYEFSGDGGRWGGCWPDGQSSLVVTPAGFEPAISTLKGSRPGPG
jgi:hypothetical protein